jgi:ligand-binding SRPBCC domain-containing protein
MNTITKTSLIKCSLEDLFAFHLDSNNIAKITPTDTTVVLLNDDSLAYEGKIVKIKVTKLFVSVYWEVKIEKLDNPNILVDVAIKSPFKYWKHQHIFTQKGNVCELKDIIEYEMPFGFLGKIAQFFVDKDIKNMFEYRHKKTKEILENRVVGDR